MCVGQGKQERGPKRRHYSRSGLHRQRQAAPLLCKACCPVEQPAGRGTPPLPIALAAVLRTKDLLPRSLRPAPPIPPT